MLQINTYEVRTIKESNEFILAKGELLVNLSQHLPLEKFEFVKDVNISIIKPGNHQIDVNQIMDIIPISKKIFGAIGRGLTNTIVGAYALLTGCDEDGKQFNNFGISAGNFADHIFYDRAGTISKTDWLIHIDVTVAKGMTDDVNTVVTVHNVCDYYLDFIRAALKVVDLEDVSERVSYDDVDRSPEKKSVVLVKQVGGSGVMHDTILFPQEPSGSHEGKTIISLKNQPIILTPNEYRDGALHALT